MKNMGMCCVASTARHGTRARLCQNHDPSQKKTKIQLSTDRNEQLWLLGMGAKRVRADALYSMTVPNSKREVFPTTSTAVCNV